MDVDEAPESEDDDYDDSGKKSKKRGSAKRAGRGGARGGRGRGRGGARGGGRGRRKSTDSLRQTSLEGFGADTPVSAAAFPDAPLDSVDWSDSGVRRSTRSKRQTRARVNDDSEEDFDDDDDDRPRRRGKRSGAAKIAAMMAKKTDDDFDAAAEPESSDDDDENDGEFGGKRRKGRRPPVIVHDGADDAAAAAAAAFDAEAFDARRTSGRRTARPNYAEIEKPKVDSEDDEDDAGSGESGEEGEEVFHTRPGEFIIAEEKSIERILAYREAGSVDHKEGLKHEIKHAVVEGADAAERRYEFLVKWKNMSYVHAEWVAQDFVEQGRMGKTRIQRFLGNQPELDPEDPVDPEWTEIDRILADHTTEDGKRYFLVKWSGLPYSESTWEIPSEVQDDTKIKEWEARNVLPPKDDWKVVTRPAPGKWKELEQIEFKNENDLRSYQIEGVNWLRFCWYNGRNSILADEMGLGKTIQSVSMIWSLYKYNKVRGPFLVIAPLSTIPHWKREFEGWTDMNALVYHGNTASREILRMHEFYHNDEASQKAGIFKFHAIVTTYEMILQDAEIFRPIKWRYVVIDEAHRLKNKQSRLLSEFKTFKHEHLLLLTGTPIQNNIEELWTLLNVLDPDNFTSSKAFMREFGELKDGGQLKKLQEILKPYLLRRLKEDVEKSIAPKEETIIEVELTTVQKKYYKAVLERNFDHLAHKGRHNLPSLINIMMQLRKCCNHPYLLKGVEEEENKEPKIGEEAMRRMIEASGKLVLIDKLLPRLKADGHKVLIFSQMVRVLDLIEDYLNYRGFKHERIDGHVRGNDRQSAIDRFSKPDSDLFVFLLCTRAGGVGINLTAADTVIIFDSDWNPQNDIQAQARCHRIGQEKAVKVYRLLTRNTYERDMFERASMKLGLDQAVLNNVDEGTGRPKFSAKEVDSLLKYGAYDIFRDDDKASEDFREENIDQILERRTRTIVHESTNAAGSSFSKASFISQGATDLDINDPDFWKKLMPDQQEKPNPDIIYQPRQRRQVQRLEHQLIEEEDLGSDEEAFESSSESSEKIEEIDSDDDNYDHDRETKGLRGLAARAAALPDHKRLKAWNLAQRNRFVHALQLYGFGRWGTLRDHARLHRTRREIALFARGYLVKIWKHAKVYDDDTVEKIIERILNVDLEDWAEPSDKKDANASMDESVDMKKEETAEVKTEVASVSETGASSGPAPEIARLVLPDDPEKLAILVASKTMAKEEMIWEVRKYAKDPILNDNKFLELHQKNATQTLRRLELLADIGELVRKDFAGISSFPKVETKEAAAFNWWTDKEDKDLLRGTWKHGFGKYSLIKRDPELCFFGRVKLSPNEEAEAAAEADGLPLDPTDDDDDKPKKKGDNKSAAGAVAVPVDAAAAAAAAAAQAAANENLYEMPGSKLLTHRVKHLVKLFGSRQFKPTKGKGGAGAGRKGKQEQDWSKRERQDIYRGLTTFGVPLKADTDEEDYDAMLANAKLKHKSVQAVKEFYTDFIAVCKYVRSNKDFKKPAPKGKKAADVDMDLSAAGDDIVRKAEIMGLTFTQGKRAADRIEFFDTLRKKILRLSEEELQNRARSVPKTAAGLPKWWDSQVHDLAVLKGIDKYGWGHWEELCMDPLFPFHAMCSKAFSEKGMPFPEAPSKSDAMDVDTKATPKKEKDDDNDDDDAESGGNSLLAKAIDFPRDKFLWKRVQQAVKYMSEEPQKLTFVSSSASASRADGDDSSKKRKRVGDEEDEPAAKRAKGDGSRHRRAVGIPRNDDGSVIFPIKLGVLTIEALGTIVFDRDTFHNEKYIWPVGFKSVRDYMSTITPEGRCKYTCEIVDDGERPLFVVTPEDDPANASKAPSASQAWKNILDRVNKLKADNSKRSSVSGPEYFGFGIREVAELIHELDGADKCAAFRGVLDAKPGQKRKAQGEPTGEEPQAKRRKDDEEEGEDEMDDESVASTDN
jgi:superfamily II DNA or RNA helicase